MSADSQVCSHPPGYGDELCMILNWKFAISTWKCSNKSIHGPQSEHRDKLWQKKKRKKKERECHLGAVKRKRNFSADMDECTGASPERCLCRGAVSRVIPAAFKMWLCAAHIMNVYWTAFLSIEEGAWIWRWCPDAHEYSGFICPQSSGMKTERTVVAVLTSGSIWLTENWNMSDTSLYGRYLWPGDR